MITLASGSPRRAKILSDLGVRFEVVKSDAPEVCYPGDPARTVRENALAKGAAARGRVNVLSADTIVWYGGRIYGKPRDLDEAKTFLRELSGRTHTVFTGVAFDGEVTVFKSDVRFRNLSDAAIEEYVARVKPTDRAGAYDIDESGDAIVEAYTGSYENIMGLPIEPVLVAALKAARLTCATAESCTGGGIGSVITSVAGASAVFKGGVISYANEVKRDILNVPQAVLDTVGAVSSETAAQMARGARALTGADLAVSVTGVAGPGGGSAEKPVGTVWFGCADAAGAATERALFAGDREAVRAQTAARAIAILIRKAAEKL